MKRNQHSTNPLGGNIYTLAQNGTGCPIILSGKGSDLNDSKALRGRAKRKMITQSMVLNLIDVVDKTRSQVDKKGYWNTYHCQNKIFSANGKFFGKYCKNRFCTLCCSIRKAHIINRYLPIVKTWPDPTFVTLTIRSVPARKLRYFIFHMLRAFKIINGRYRKRSQRGKGMKLVGLKSLECNFNPLKRTYNPHFHLIVYDRPTAKILVDEWLKIWTKKFALPVSQDIRRVHNHEKALIEIVKYGSKIFTEPDVNDKVKSKLPVKIHAAALDNIFKAMKGTRIFERFGFNLVKEENASKSKYNLVHEIDEWEFERTSFDWVNVANGKRLTEFHPTSQLLDLLTNHINTDLQ